MITSLPGGPHSNPLVGKKTRAGLTHNTKNSLFSRHESNEEIEAPCCQILMIGLIYLLYKLEKSTIIEVP